MASDRDLDFPAVQPLIAEKLVPSPVKASGTGSGAKCAQCGQVIRHMPILLKNITCKDCYGTDRYRHREAASLVPSAGLNTSTPENPATV